ncbi:MAG TPA: carboxymuconolactone decarboxylase family protein [Firmicutes bacterium]|nr:carboxymuconolactone decarboxylase family protein [Bacillota bacterium]
MKKITTGRDTMNDFAPKFAQPNDNVLFGEAWSRADKLSAGDRGPITLSVLIGSGIWDRPFVNHIRMGKEHGITEAEISEALTLILAQLAFYAGCAKAWAALRIAKEVCHA